MRDYEAVLKQARTCANRKYCDIGGNCEYYDLDVCCQGGEKDILQDAADAIEELLITTSAQKETIEVLRARNSAQADMLDGEWVSVDERLPKKDEMVIVYYSWIGQSGTEYKEVSLATLDEIRYCGSKLLEWMPLPEPPKEVQDG